MIFMNIKIRGRGTHTDFTDLRPEDQGLWGALSPFDLSLSWQVLAPESMDNSSSLESTFVTRV